MKRFLLILTVLVLTLALCSAALAAGGTRPGRGYAANGQGRNYVDADGDGVCDNRAANGQGRNYVDADGDGVCDNRGTQRDGGRGLRRGRQGK